MADLFYSDAANNILDLFYNVDAIVYVEGKDDIPFWELIFEKFTTLKVEVQEVGSCTALKPYIDKIITGKLNSIVACDSDFSLFDSNAIQHQNIIRTYGYSIENTFISHDCLFRVIKTHTRGSIGGLSPQEIEKWIENFTNGVESLIYLDIYNHKHKLGINVIGDNANRFMTSQKSSDLCNDRVNNHTKTILSKPEMSGFDPKTIQLEMQNKAISPKQAIRGHFLFSGVAKYVSCMIKNLGGNAPLSNDSLYTALILAFNNIFNSTHLEYNYYQESLSRITIENSNPT
ncbi:DUF4435 domain-containing protein [Plesiomonas shigelloides]|uniref:DUF4435 domain-containing protein n=1 Tax=Plesiomonas shigelloides TaxID=703 RepID=UPI00131BB564|nr:DUF4435 domain-containing protein [Plesiomonas shigelloides]